MLGFVPTIVRRDAGRHWMVVLMHVDKVSHVLGIVCKGFTTSPIITLEVAFVGGAFLFTPQSAKFVSMA